jgi:PEP-CTERM motif
MRKSLVSAVALAIAVSGTANAQTFDGSTLDYQYYFPDSTSPYSGADNGSFVVGAGVEVTNIVDNVGTLDISGTNIFIDFSTDSSFTPGTFNGWILSDQTNSLADILGVSINGSTNLAGFSMANLSFTGNTISVNWQGLDFDANTVVSLDVSLGQAVPEPATWAMMLLGFGAAGVALRRGRRRQLAQLA